MSSLPELQWARAFRAYVEKPGSNLTAPPELTPDTQTVLSHMPCSACFNAELGRCIDPNWRGTKSCEHVNIYAKHPHKMFSHRACSRLIGHCASIVHLLEQLEVAYNGTPGVVLFVEDDVDMSAAGWPDQIARFMERHHPSGWDIAKLTGGGVLGAPLGVQCQRHVHALRLRHGKDWWSGLPWPLWGTAAMLFNTLSISRVLRAIRRLKFGTADAALLESFISGGIDIALSSKRILYPRLDSEETSTIEAELVQ
jgi:hypothetical protein